MDPRMGKVPDAGRQPASLGDRTGGERKEGGREGGGRVSPLLPCQRAPTAASDARRFLHPAAPPPAAILAPSTEPP